MEKHFDCTWLSPSEAVPSQQSIVEMRSSFHEHLQAFERAFNQQRVSTAKQRRIDDPMIFFRDLKQPPPQPVSMLLEKTTAKATQVDHQDLSVELDTDKQWYD